MIGAPRAVRIALQSLLLGLFRQVFGLDSPVQGYQTLIDPTPVGDLRKAPIKWRGGDREAEGRGPDTAPLRLHLIDLDAVCAPPDFCFRRGLNCMNDRLLNFVIWTAGAVVCVLLVAAAYYWH